MKTPFARLASLALASLVAATAFAGDAPPTPRRGGKPPPAPPAMGDPAMGDAPPAAPPPSDGRASAKDWSAQTGKVKFVIGYDAGMDQAWSSGRSAMIFFTSATDDTCKSFARHVFGNDEVVDRAAEFVEILVDADVEKQAVARFQVKKLPTVVFAGPQEEAFLVVPGDTTVEDFGEILEQAKANVPPKKVPVEDILLLETMQSDLKAALLAGDVKKAIGAATALSITRRPKTYRDLGTKALGEIDAQGAERLAAAKQQVTAGKAAAARTELEKLALEYRGRDVGRQAAEAVAKLDEAGGK